MHKKHTISRSATLLGLAAILLLPQAGMAQESPAVTTVVEAAKLEALLHQEGGDNPLRVVDSPDGHYGVFVLSSEAKPAPATVNGGYHSAVGEIYHVINGTGVFVTNGEIENPEPVPADSLRYSRAGPGESGVLRNPQLVEYGPGSIFIVPPGVPHNATHEVFTRTDIIIYRFDPARTLPKF